MPGNNRGFTLTELMIVVAIAVILAVVALPSYTGHIMRNNRVDATSALLRLAAEQEKFYLQNNTYGDMNDLGNPETDSGFYVLAIPTANADTFTATATPASGGPQVDDETCASFSITAAGQRLATSDGGSDTSNECW